MKQGVSLPNTNKLDKDILLANGYLDYNNKVYSMTDKAKDVCAKLDSYFILSKKKTDIQLMGKDFVEKINTYREVFPAKKLPSGKPARNNVKALGEAFRWCRD